MIERDDPLAVELPFGEWQRIHGRLSHIHRKLAGILGEAIDSALKDRGDIEQLRAAAALNWPDDDGED